MKQVTQQNVSIVEETRQRILEAATNMFLKNGIEGTQIQEIAAAANISRASIYRYFPDKLTILTNVILHIYHTYPPNKNWKEYLKEHSDASGIALLKQYMAISYIDGEQEPIAQFQAAFASYIATVELPDDIAEKLRSVAEYGNNKSLEEIIKKGIRDGSIRPDIDVRLMSLTISNILFSLRNRLLTKNAQLFAARDIEKSSLMQETIDLIIKALENNELTKKLRL